MEKVAQRDLEILSALATGVPITQRGLARRLGIALGLANLYLKRLAKKGYIKVTTIPPHRIKYLLTPKGIAQKTRLTYEYMEYSLQLYRHTRHVLRETLLPLVRQDKRRTAIYGTSEAAELAFLTLRELGLSVTAVFGENGHGRVFLGVPVIPLIQVDPEQWDLFIVASFTQVEGMVKKLREQGIPSEKIAVLQ